MKKIYAEMWIGNDSFFSTEFEQKDKEKRVNKLIFPKNTEEIYFRLWLFKLVIITSFFKGIKFKKKLKNNFKILIGFGGK